MKKKYSDFIKIKNNEKIVMLTGYDYPTARIIDRCNVDIVLVGDSVGTNILGYETVADVTMDDMLHHTRAVAKASKNTFVLSDLPFASYKTPELAVKNARRLINTGADAVKIESERDALASIKAVVEDGIAVCGHIGFTPQTIGLKASVQGKDIKRAEELIALAKQCEAIGTFMLVLELIPEELADFITQTITIPTIGIGSGVKCDGEVQVIGDILGMSERVFKHTKMYTDISTIIESTLDNYSQEVKASLFPAESNSSHASDEVIKLINRGNW